MTERRLPQNKDYEESLLGALLVDDTLLVDVSSVILPEDFFIPSYRFIYTAMLRLFDRTDKIDLISVITELNSQNLLEQVGGRQEIMRLASLVPSGAGAITYARGIKRTSTLRKLIAFSNEVSEQCFDGVQDYNSFIDNVELKLGQITVEGRASSYVKLKDVLVETLDQVEAQQQKRKDVTGVPSGFLDLDIITSGWQKSDLIILAARPAMGKTSLTLNMLVHAALTTKIPAAFFSLEMSNIQLALRILCSEARIDQSKLRRGIVSDVEWGRFMKAIKSLSSTNIFLDDTPALPIASFRARARLLKKEHNIGIIFVDYLQLMKGSAGSSTGSREQEISEISRNLKAVAKELDIPVIALAQLNRGVESRTDKRPMMSDLRESGAIEQDADIILFIYRDEVYKKDTQDKNIAELIVSKHRNGSIGTVRLRFNGEYTRFDNLDTRSDGDIPPGTI